MGDLDKLIEAARLGIVQELKDLDSAGILTLSASATRRARPLFITRRLEGTAMPCGCWWRLVRISTPRRCAVRRHTGGMGDRVPARDGWISGR